MDGTYRPFVDWMKAIGIFLIIYNHTQGAVFGALTPPILIKQLGVTCFIFVLGYQLARERRSVPLVLYNRLFEMVLFGVAIAVLVSLAWGIAVGDLQLSNYAPFVFGANVFLMPDGFPSNPTTWFIGTYIHLLIVWALVLRRRVVAGWLLAATVIVEIPVRALLAREVDLFFAYMAVPNWATVGLLGYYVGGRADLDAWFAHRPVWPWLTVLVGGLALWPLAAGGLAQPTGFPFDAMAAPASWAQALTASAAVSGLYVGCTLALFGALRPLQRQAPAPVRLYARNTIVLFIAHMPIVYGLVWLLGPVKEDYWLRTTIDFVVCFFVLGALSEGVRRVMRPRRLRDGLWAVVERHAPWRSDRPSSVP